jgi:hypothetical protein
MEHEHDRLVNELAKTHTRELCVQEVEQLAELSQQVTVLLHKLDTVIKQIEAHQLRIVGILRTEVQHSFSR